MLKKKKNSFLEHHNICNKKFDIRTLYTEPFHVITIDNEPVGNPLSETEANIITTWLNSIIYNNNY